ncbi:hypothetical protein BJ166DRAFT_239350 [Pestalotiopsis sp. NC0098]|nr:hypothetical protein BJ166DRAFT_239350 [Pestalotiopsis sp. NC0098]
MKFSSVSSHALCGAVASALTLPNTSPKRGLDVTPLDLDQFGWFETLSLEDAKSGIVKSHNGTLSQIVGEIAQDFSGVPDAISNALNIAPTKNKGDADTTETDSFSKVNTVQAASASCPNPNIRFEWRNYSDTDRHAFVDAISCLMKAPASGNYPPAQNRYEDIVRVHQAMTSTIHGNNIFLFWHRYYVWTLEQIMRDECGFDRAFPWWDETLDAGNFHSSSMFTADFFGSLPAATNGQGTCITDGAFANHVCHIGPGTGNTDHCLSRAVDESLTAQSNQDFVNTCNSRTNYPDMENCAELGPHAYGHNGVGSVMADVSSSPSDPVFFMHHLFVDRNFWLWQNGDASRKTAINGCIDTASPCTPLTLDTVISVQGLRPDVTVRDIIDTQDGAICYLYTY